MEYKGFTYTPTPKTAWDNLSMLEKSEMMKVAVRNGITDLKTIKEKYNEFAEGGDTKPDWSYASWKRQIAEHMGIRPDEDNTYDYEAFFKKYPEEAWRMLKGDPTAHFSDEFKTVYHPTFSSKSIGNDGSIYSGVRNPKTNPQGLIGGTWSPDYHTFTMSPDGYRGPVSMDERKWYLENAEDNGVQLREADGSLPIFDGIPWGGVLPNITITGNKFAEGGNIYSGDKEETQQMEVSKSPHVDLAVNNPWLYQKLHPAQTKAEKYEPTTFAGRVAQVAGANELGQKFADYTSSVVQQVPVVGLVPSALDLGYDTNRLYHNPSLTAIKDVTLDAASLVPTLRKTMKGWWMKGNSGPFITEAGQIINNPRVASTLEVALQPFRTAINTGVYGARAADFLDDSKAYLKEMYNSSKIGKHFPIKALGGPLVEAAMNEYRSGGNIHIKPENRGKFTALKERTGRSATWFKEHGTPAQKKMAIFALNSRHWKHGLGGNLFSGEEEGSQQMNRANIFRRPNGQYFYQASPDSEEIAVTPIMTTLGDESMWTYQDENGRRYTPRLSLNEWTVAQGETPSTWENIIVASNSNYMNPILGAPARWKASWDNNTNVIRALWDNPAVMGHPLGMAAKAAEHLAGNEGISKTIRLYQNSDGSDNARWLWQRSLVGDALESLGLLPAVGMGYSATKPAIDRTVTTLQNNYPALFDPYTSWDATLGYHGDNIFSRAIGTVGRRYGYTPKAGVPEFHRRLKINKPEDMRITDDGKLIISSGRTGEGHDGIVNFATSEPARSHQQHKMLSSIDDYIIDPKAIGTQDFKSIQPSDTFFETGELAIDPKNITLISGNTDVLNQARSMGIRTLSSPRLRELKAATAPQSQGIKGLLARIDTSRSGNDGQLGTEIQRLASMRGTPTISDYAYFENMTGLNSGVIPNTEFNLANAPEILGRWGKIRRTPTFNNVVYDPATSIETIYREAKMGTRPWADYYEALEKMPSARSFNGELLDWSADKWLGRRVGGFDSEDVAKLAGHTPEYLNIEKTAKANGTWLKNADGSDWQGYIDSRGKVSKDPHVWVMQQSGAGQKWSDELLGTGMNSERAAGFPTYNGELWTATTPKVSQTFMSELKEPDFAWNGLLSRVRHGYIPQWKMNLERMLDLQKGRAFGITVPKDMKTLSVNAEGRDWNRVTPVGENVHMTTRDYVKNFLNGENQAIRINNVNEWHRPFGINTDDLILGKGTPRKIWEGNNGDLDPLILNGYKAFGGYLTVPNKNRRE